MAVFEESDCCGNGCANCVLDAKPSKQNETNDDKINILNSYTNFNLKSKTPIGELQEVIELHLTSSQLGTVDSNNLILDVPSGHHVMMRAPLKCADGKLLLRPYSPFWVDKRKLEFKILVNLSPNGPMSKYISSLCTGDQVEFRGPIGGKYAYESIRNFKHLVLISQGVAIAPTLSIVSEILDNEDEMMRIIQFACFSDLQHAYFRKELQEFKKFWNYAAHIYLSKQKCQDLECIDKQECALNCKDLVKKLFYKEKVYTQRLTGERLRRIVGPEALKTAAFVISGSRNFQNQFLSDIKELDLDIVDENIFLL